MTDAHRKTFAKALAYLIKQTPLPKTGAAREERTELLQDLINAGRPIKVAEPAALTSGQPGADAPVSNLLEVRIVEASGPVGQVREGTVFGTPAATALQEPE